MSSVNGPVSECPQFLRRESPERPTRSVTPDGGVFAMDLEYVPCEQFMPENPQPRPPNDKENSKKPRASEKTADTAETEQGVIKNSKEPCKRSPLISSPENRPEEPAFPFGESFFSNVTAQEPPVFPDRFV